MTFAGANPDQLDIAADRIQQQGRAIERSARRLRASVNTSPWHGRSADRFRSEFNSHYFKSLVNAASFLESAQAELRRNAREQRDASSVRGSNRRGPWFHMPKFPRFPHWGWPRFPKFPGFPGFRFPAIPWPRFPGLPHIELPSFVDFPRDILIGLGLLGVAVAPSSKGGSQPAPQPQAPRPAAPPAPPAPALDQGPGNFSQQHLVEVAEKYNGAYKNPLNTTPGPYYGTTYDGQGQCAVWVRNWVTEAGGQYPGGDHPFAALDTVGVRVPQPVPGDVFQRSFNDTWGGSPHTAIVKSFDKSTGKITLIEGNVVSPGVVGVKTYDLSTLNKDGHEIRFYRLGKT